MYARQSVLASPLFGDDIKKLLPLITPGGSDSAMLDNAVELLTLAGRSIPHVMSIADSRGLGAGSHHAEARQGVLRVSRFTDGAVGRSGGSGLYRWAGHRAKLDRNGLRPGRYVITTDGLAVMASEAGVLPIKPEMW